MTDQNDDTIKPPKKPWHLALWRFFVRHWKRWTGVTQLERELFNAKAKNAQLLRTMSGTFDVRISDGDERWAGQKTTIMRVRWDEKEFLHKGKPRMIKTLVADDFQSNTIVEEVMGVTDLERPKEPPEDIEVVG